MLSDIEISQSCKLEAIEKIARTLGLFEDDIENYGRYKAKITFEALNRIKNVEKPNGKLVLVTAMTPTPAGEGKSTVSIGLGDALHKLKKNVLITLREPSLGPCFGRKGGATGGGLSQIAPMEEINLHFTGDIHAVTTANNLLAAMLDNHLHQGNELKIDINTISWKRCVDLNDRSLRKIKIGQGDVVNGVERADGFNISVASEIMAVLCLSQSIKDLKENLSKIVVAKDCFGNFITAQDIHAVGAMTAVLKDALRPNLVQTLEQTPVLVHGGPFANIAHGCNSLIATQTALKLADFVVTEAGFGADLGAEKFMDIKCRKGNLYPSAIVLVATVRALKMHGGVALNELSVENTAAVEAGFANLQAHIENMQKFGVPVLVAVNRFSSDTEKELETVKKLCEKTGTCAIITEGWEKGGVGCVNLAEAVVRAVETENKFRFLYEDSLPLKQKIEKIAQHIYRADGVSFSETALNKISEYEQKGYKNYAVCIAKTQNSISHDKNILGCPQGYTLPINDVHLSAGAGFVVAFAGNILTMPGLPKHPAAENIDVDDDGIIQGIF